jgi:hypothetical protein
VTILVPCLIRLRTEFGFIAPTRSRVSDGWIGDTAHQHSVSDHNPDETGSVPIRDADSVNEVHAVDVDSDLNTDGLSMEMVVQHLLARCRSGAERRLRYIIYNRRIWEASNDWRQRTYGGLSPHVEHAHFSASYDTAREASMASWQLEGIPVALTDADKAWIKGQIDGLKAEIDDVAGDAASALLNSKLNIGVQPGAAVNMQPVSGILRWTSWEHNEALDRLDQVLTKLDGQGPADPPPTA